MMEEAEDDVSTDNLRREIFGELAPEDEPRNF
jgi:hypothetical protein